tara:strand:- start:84 stop:215 length:132 start_codon:yes stop_codon:yes gene_type:complete
VAADQVALAALLAQEQLIEEAAAVVVDLVGAPSVLLVLVVLAL